MSSESPSLVGDDLFSSVMEIDMFSSVMEIDMPTATNGVMPSPTALDECPACPPAYKPDQCAICPGKNQAGGKAKGGMRIKPRSLSLQYLSNGINYNDQQKDSCIDGNYPFNNTLTVMGETLVVENGTIFTINAQDKLPPHLSIYMSQAPAGYPASEYDCSLHTSCSERLAIGDQFGPFKVVGNPNGVCDGPPRCDVCAITPPDAENEEDDVEGVEMRRRSPKGKGGKGGKGKGKGHKNKKRPEALWVQYNTNSTEGPFQGCDILSSEFRASDTIQVNGLSYNVSDDQPPFIIYPGPKSNGVKFPVNSEISWTDYDTNETVTCEFHTSCSRPLRVGDTFGPLEIVGGGECAVPEAEMPEVETPEAETPEVETPEVETPEVETPEVETPEVEMPEAEMPEAEMPEVEAPEVETPEVEMPEVEMPEVEMPEVEAPEVETPEIGVPAAAFLDSRREDAVLSSEPAPNGSTASTHDMPAAIHLCLIGMMWFSKMFL